jgi:hypothetical protein
MGQPVVDAGCSIQCPHGGKATVSPGNARVKVGGNYALLVADVMTVAGCPFTTPAGVPMPCVTIQWSAPAAKVTVNGVAVLLQSSQGLCMNAASAPQGSAMLSGVQSKSNGE